MVPYNVCCLLACPLSALTACILGKEISGFSRISESYIDSDPVIASAYFKFANGTNAYIGSSSGLNVRIGGEKGNLAVYADGSHIQVFKSRKADAGYYLNEHTANSLIRKSATVVAMEELVESINNDTTSPISADEIEMGIKMLLGCVWSHLNSNANIAISDIPEHLFVSGKYQEKYA